jgi:biopolymer transport protein ExbD
MRLPTRRPISDRINMTPMIDVTFLLIIFFLLSSRLAQQEAINLELPAAASGVPASDDQRPRLTMNVSATGSVMFGNRQMQPQQMAGRLRIERDRLGSDLEVHIRADRAIPYGAIEPILLACADANIWNVTFAVFERTEHRD